MRRNKKSIGTLIATTEDGDNQRILSKQTKKCPSLGRFHTTGIIDEPQFLPLLLAPRLQQRAKIIVGFPGIGKSFISKDPSNQFSWLNIHDEPGYAKGAEESFHEGVLVLAQQPGVLLLPAHRTVGEFLVKENLIFTSVFPKRILKEEYLRRYRVRGSSEGFVELVEQRWDQFLDNMWYHHGRCNHVELAEGQFLKDVFGRILLQADANRLVERL